MPSTLGILFEGMRCVAGAYVLSSLDVFCFNFTSWPSSHVVIMLYGLMKAFGSYYCLVE